LSDKILKFIERNIAPQILHLFPSECDVFKLYPTAKLSPDKQSAKSWASLL